VSPDGARVALATQTDVWVYDVLRTTLGRVTTHPAADTRPLWTPDGQRIIFTSARAGYPELFWRSPDGTGTEHKLLARAEDLVDLRGNGWSADGRQLLITQVSSNAQGSIEEIAIDRPSDARVLVKNDSNNDYAAVSPDGRWIAYQSNLSGRPEIYVERYPELGNRQQISTGGGTIPLWSHDGRELFFRSLDSQQILAVPVRSGSTLVAGRPEVLFEFAMVRLQALARPYDVAPDGRFAIIRTALTDGTDDTASDLVFVQNWFEELKRLVPTD
jgi:serine/threonine-protein kinase